MKILGMHHITVAVRDVEAAKAAFATLFGAEGGEAAAVEAFNARSLDAQLDGLTLQFVEPAGDESALTRFIDRRGEGLYNIALEVEALDAAIEELRARGIRVSDPVEATPGVRSAFIAAAATHGVSVQLVEVGGGQREAGSEAEGETPESGSQKPDEEAATPPLRDLRPDEWEEWSDVD